MPDAPISEMVMERPRPALRPFVDRYVGYRYVGFPPGLHRGLPSRHLTCIISLDHPVRMQLDAADGPPGRGQTIALQAFVGGLQTWPAHIFHDGVQVGIAVELTPLGSGAVLGARGDELAGRVVSLDDLLGTRGRHLTERLLNAEGWPTRFRLLDAALAAGLSELHAPSAEMGVAWSLLTSSPGQVSVDDLARHVGWSRRHLTERIRQETGLPPRQLARVLRFERSCALLRRAQPATGTRTMTEISLEAGYYDHAHLLHEWRRLAGCTPTAWLAEVLPPVQDAHVDDGRS